MLLLDDYWTWDFWIAKEEDRYHLFFLKAPKSLGDPDLRHEAARIGHAVGIDLRNWDVLEDALGPGPEGDWDDLATWTGSVTYAQGRWHMFYTGINRSERGQHQRIGHATSDDLMTWHKTPGPVLEMDTSIYQGAVPGWDAVDWRDPWVYWSEQAGEYRMLLTCRSARGTVDERGVVGEARSQDLVQWRTCEPTYAPQQFAHLEVPQVFCENGRWYLSFSVYAARHSLRRRGATPAQTGTHYVTGLTEFGPWEQLDANFFCGDPQGELYAGRFERDPAGRLVFLAFLQFVDGGPFVGGLSDPFPVHVADDGRLTLVRKPDLLPAGVVR